MPARKMILAGAALAMAACHPRAPDPGPMPERAIHFSVCARGAETRLGSTLPEQCRPLRPDDASFFDLVQRRSADPCAFHRANAQAIVSSCMDERHGMDLADWQRRATAYRLGGTPIPVARAPLGSAMNPVHIQITQ